MSSYKLKVLIVGIKGCGMLELLSGFTGFQKNYKLTIGVNIYSKEVELSNGVTKITLSIWNIGSQQRFQFIRSTFFKGGAGALLVFDLSKSETWISIKNWFTEIKKITGDIPFLLIGNRVEKVENENKAEYENWAKTEGGSYIELRSGDMAKGDSILIALADKIINNIKKN